jgi:hypothetical protein
MATRDDTVSTDQQTPDGWKSIDDWIAEYEARRADAELPIEGWASDVCGWGGRG